jgi:YHS domain-containing protein
VCGRELTRDTALLTAELKGRTYLFCSERCRMLFSIRPAWFLEREGESDQRKAS